VRAQVAGPASGVELEDFGPGGPGGRSRRPYSRTRQRKRKRAGAVLGLLVVVGAAGAIASLAVARHPHYATFPLGKGRTVKVPQSHLSPLRAKIVAIAESQVGYQTEPPDTYCNKFSAYWSSGSATCANGELSEEWCADFAAWVWQKAGVPVTYQYINGDLNSSAASFYEWGVRLHTWHPLGSGYVPQPGDVAVYGLDASQLIAAHVAIVIGYKPGAKGPIAVNGDGDLTAFSIVEVRNDEYYADTQAGTQAGTAAGTQGGPQTGTQTGTQGGRGAALSGYVSPD